MKSWSLLQKYWSHIVFAIVLIILSIGLNTTQAFAVTLKTVNSELDLPRVDYMMDVEAIFRQVASQDYTTYSRASSDMTLRGGPSSAFGGGDGRTYDSPPFSVVGSLQTHQNSFIEYHFSNVIIGRDGTRYDMIVREDNMRGIRYGSSNNGPYQTVYGFMQDTYNQSWATWSAGDNNAGAVDITFKVVEAGSDTPAPEGTFLLAFYDLDQPRPYSSPRPISVDYDWDESVMFDDTSATDGYAYVLPGARLQVVNNNRVKPSNGAPSSSTNTWREAGVITVGNSSGAKVTLQMFSGRGSQTVSTYLFLKPIEYRVDARVVGGGGSVSEPDRPILAKWDYMTKIQADPGYAIDTITVDGKPYSLSNLSNITGSETTPTSGTLSIPNVLANHHVVVRFRQALGTIVVQKASLHSDQVQGAASTFAHAEFSLASASDPQTSVAKATTDEAGVARFSDVVAGSYIITETKAPNGYEINPNPVSVNVEAGKTSSITVRDPLKFLRFTLQKQDAQTGTTPQGKAKLIARGKIVYSRTNNPYITDDTTHNLYPGDTVLEDIEVGPDGIKLPLLPYANYEFVETEAGVGYELNTTPIPLTPSDGVEVDTPQATDKYYYDLGSYDAHDVGDITSAPKVVITNNIQHFDITVNKRDKDTGVNPQGDATFEGAIFSIARKSDPQTSLASATTNAHGQATFTNLITDDYIITETKAPNGYDINPEPVNISVGSQSDLSFVVADPIKKVSFTIAKRDSETGEVAQGKAQLNARGDVILSTTSKAVFYKGKIYLPGEVIISNFYFDNTGTPTPDLPFGTYIFHETEAGVGYLPTAADITLDPHNPHKVYEMANKAARMRVTIKKTDETTGRVSQGDATFEGAVFSIARKSDPNTPLASATTDAEGMAYFENLVMDDYLVTETQAPKGYELADAPLEISVELGGKLTYEFADRLKTTQFSVVKRDSETGEVAQGKAQLSGVADIILASTHPIVYEGKTIQPGEVVLKDFNFDSSGNMTPSLPYATYSIKETKAGVGYIVSAPDQTITSDATNRVVTMANTAERFDIAIRKVDLYTGEIPQGGATFEGAEFSLASASDPNTPLASAITDAEGIAYFENLVMDDYLVTETKAPHGYKLASDPLEIAVEPGVLLSYDFADEIETFSVIVRNEDKYTGTTPQGKGKLEATGAITLSSASSPIVFNGKTIQPGGVVIENFHYDNNGAATPDLPFGEYVIHEDVAGAGYSLTAPDVSVTPRDDKQTIPMPDTPLRFDIALHKQDAHTGKALANIAFMVTSKTTGEAHVIVTDAQGNIDTSQRAREKLNTLDSFVQEDQYIGMSDARANIFFGVGQKEDRSLLYDEYDVYELRTHTNDKYFLAKFDLDTTASESEILDLGIIKNNPLPVPNFIPDKHNDDPYTPEKTLELPKPKITSGVDKKVSEPVSDPTKPKPDVVAATPVLEPQKEEPVQAVQTKFYAKTGDSAYEMLPLAGILFICVMGGLLLIRRSIIQR